MEKYFYGLFVGNINILHPLQVQKGIAEILVQQSPSWPYFCIQSIQEEPFFKLFSLYLMGKVCNAILLSKELRKYWNRMAF